MALAIDLRPKSLNEFAGNQGLKKSLNSILSRKPSDIPHAFLFYGLSGGGKTTLGGIVANHLKCDPIELYEVNSAHFRGIDTAKELESSIRYSPIKGDVRLWIFNECHMWTIPAMNAMLDMIEKAPPHVYFILTTTNPEKIITPLRKRCVEYEVLPLSDDEMFDFLIGIVESEKADVPDEILERIIPIAKGSSRNALQLLEKVIDLDVADMKKVAMELEDEETTIKNLIDALHKKRKWADIAKIIKNLTGEPESIRYAILGYCGAVLLSGKDDKQYALIMTCFSKNTYDTGKNGIVLAAYDVICG